MLLRRTWSKRVTPLPRLPRCGMYVQENRTTLYRSSPSNPSRGTVRSEMLSVVARPKPPLHPSYHSSSTKARTTGGTSLPRAPCHPLSPSPQQAQGPLMLPARNPPPSRTTMVTTAAPCKGNEPRRSGPNHALTALHWQLQHQHLVVPVMLPQLCLSHLPLQGPTNTGGKNHERAWESTSVIGRGCTFQEPRLFRMRGRSLSLPQARPLIEFPTSPTFLLVVHVGDRLPVRHLSRQSKSHSNIIHTDHPQSMPVLLHPHRGLEPLRSRDITPPLPVGNHAHHPLHTIPQLVQHPITGFGFQITTTLSLYRDIRTEKHDSPTRRRGVRTRSLSIMLSIVPITRTRRCTCLGT